MLNIDLAGKRAFVAGVADDGGFGFAISKALADAGATICVGTWPPALGIFTKLLEGEPWRRLAGRASTWRGPSWTPSRASTRTRSQRSSRAAGRCAAGRAELFFGGVQAVARNPETGELGPAAATPGVAVRDRRLAATPGGLARFTRPKPKLESRPAGPMSSTAAIRRARIAPPSPGNSCLSTPATADT